MTSAPVPQAEPFKLAPVGGTFNVAATMPWITKTYGIGKLRQLREMAVLALSSSKISPDEYVRYALFRPDMPMAEKRSFLSPTAGALLNRRLIAPGRGLQMLTSDKVLTGLLLRGAGIATTPMLALYAPGAPRPGLRHLADAAELARYLAEEAPLPCFGKPLDGTFAIGGAAIVAREGGNLVLSDGQSLPATEFAAAVARHFPRGYLFQPLLRMHPALVPLCGAAAGSLRIVTLLGPQGPAPLYATFKLPGKGGMTDGPAIDKPNGMAEIDLKTGRFERAQFNNVTNLETLTEALATPVPLATAVIPQMAEAVALACETHRLLPSHGILGLDVIVTEDGPLIGEVNSSPVHVLYQRPADRGVLNPEFAARFAETEALIKARFAAKG